MIRMKITSATLSMCSGMRMIRRYLAIYWVHYLLKFLGRSPVLPMLLIYGMRSRLPSPHVLARVPSNTRMALASTVKESLSVFEYYIKMKKLADEMESAGKKLDLEEFTSYVLAGLDMDYNSVVSAIAAGVEPITSSELLSQMLSHELRLEILQGGHDHQPSANSATRGCGGPAGQGGRGHGRGDFSSGRRCGSNNNNNRPQCQLCGKIDHVVLKCWKRFNHSFTGEEKYVNVAANSYSIDTSWYLDTGATDHITSNLDKLSMKGKYTGGDQVMDITHVGHSTIHTHDHDIVLKNILHVPQASKNLVSVHKLTFDNDAFMEFHPYFFLIKDGASRRILHLRQEQVFSVSTTTSLDRWHSRLGHSSFSVIKFIVSHNKISCSSNFDKELVCDSCQRAKSHQLPYPRSFSVSKKSIGTCVFWCVGSCTHFCWEKELLCEFHRRL
jgi:hypothetical protein